MSSHTFFFYGSLMDLELLEAVIDRESSHLAFTPGWIDGHATETAQGYTFPTLVSRDGERTHGLVASGLTDEDVARISYFEDTEYEPVLVEAGTAQGPVSAKVYMSTASLASSGEAWVFEHWQQHHKRVLVAVTRRVMREHYGVTPFEEIDAHWHRIKAEIEREI